MNASPPMAHPTTEQDRTRLLRAAYRGPQPGLRHDAEAERVRKALWQVVAQSPEDPSLAVHREAALQSILSLIPVVALAGTHLRGRSDTRILRHWQRTGLRPAGFRAYRAAGVLGLVGILVTGILTLGAGIGAAYLLLKRQSERMQFHGPPRRRGRGRRSRKGARRSARR